MRSVRIMVFAIMKLEYAIVLIKWLQAMVKEMQERKVIVGLEIFLQRVIMIKKLFIDVYERNVYI